MTIAWKSNGGTGPCIVLIHANSYSSTAFSRQLNDPLLGQFRLIAIDLPGHGDSSHSPDPSGDYGARGSARFILAAAQALNVRTPVVVGWGLGGNLVLECQPSWPDIKGIMVAGTPPLAVPPATNLAYRPHLGMEHGFQSDLTEMEMKNYCRLFFRKGFEIPDLFLNDIKRADPLYRSMMGTCVGRGEFNDELRIIKALTYPLAIVLGTEDQLVEPDYVVSLPTPTLWRGAVQTIENAGHTPQWEQPEAFNALLAAFVQDCQ